MKIHALTTGTASLKHAFLHARPGLRGRIAIFRPDEWSGPLPIHAWLIDHDGRKILVDCGEVSTVHDLPFCRYAVTEQDELPHALVEVGVTLDELDTVLVTHLHSDHHNGSRHVRGPVLVSETEWAFAHSRKGRFAQRVTRSPIPPNVDFRPFALRGGPFGGFEQSHPLTDDGRVVAVATPGHTAGHVSVIAIDDDGTHVLLAGDVSDSLEQLTDRRVDPVADDQAVLVQTMDRVLLHAREHPTVYLPAHDPQSAARLRDRTLLTAPA